MPPAAGAGVTAFGFVVEYPVGHFGFTAIIFLDVLPFTQVIDVFLAAAGFATDEGVGFGAVTSAA